MEKHNSRLRLFIGDQELPPDFLEGEIPTINIMESLDVDSFAACVAASGISVKEIVNCVVSFCVIIGQTTTEMELLTEAIAAPMEEKRPLLTKHTSLPRPDRHLPVKARQYIQPKQKPRPLARSNIRNLRDITRRAER